MKISNEELAARLHKQATEETLVLLPIFTGIRNKSLSVDMLHKSYYPDVSVTSILFNNRATSILETSEIKTIGQLLLTSYSDLLLFRNCGLQTIEVFQEELREFILDKEFDYSPYWDGLESMLRNVLNVKERNILILLYRLGINQKAAMTLQKCGDKFGITREAIRQTLNQIAGIIIHPETEYKLRPFWLAVDKLLKKKDIMTSEELSRKLKDKMSWKIKPEAHALERILKMKPDKYIVAFNKLVGLTTSKCFECDRLEGFLLTVMGDNVELTNQKVFRLFHEEFEKCCPDAKSLSKQMQKSLVELHLQKELKRYRNFKRKPVYIVNLDLIEKA